ncbi:sugar phosphate isomerase/epimerase family protein [Tunicatimonas pelagia]|uniref:sugar phosphate isomerase/epimerase family protein n=1 Tax=Tunicatimonas pelagia TaxID=931531 RepID=UPI00266533D9|nr:sugar phosphate isomerase/epimerase family protein [Tunicatimonas pelagia]WKN45124.1 sugar phosphate isomerase/epimerase [Tunicatimonas pelagia]
MKDLSQLCIHTITTKPWSIEESSERFAETGVKGITVWRDALEGRNMSQTGNRLRNHGLNIVSLCRGGFFPAASAEKRQAAIDDNRRAIDEAAELGAPMVVLVCGAEPNQSLTTSRQQIQEGIEAILPHAEANQVQVTIEPLHPMYADTRSAVNTLGQANDMAEAIDSPWVGIAADVYHLWWDDNLQSEIMRCGRNGNLSAFHVCDWRVPTEDFLLDRGLMGEGCIDVPQIRKWVEEAGFEGMIEVEIFSNRYWSMDQAEFLNQIIEAYCKHV